MIINNMFNIYLMISFIHWIMHNLKLKIILTDIIYIYIYIYIFIKY